MLDNSDKYILIIFLCSSEKAINVSFLLRAKPFNSNLRKNLIREYFAIPGTSKKNSLNVRLKLFTFPPYKKPRDQ
jgi:hypothetical protein